MMALSWPLAIAGMMIGARIGIAFLMEGSLKGSCRDAEAAGRSQ